MTVEELYTETIKRVLPRGLTVMEEFKLRFVCKKTIEENPKLVLEFLLTTTIAYLNYMLGQRL